MSCAAFGLTTVPIFASILRVPLAAVAPMIVVSCAIGAYAIQNAMFDIWLMLGFGVVGYTFKKIKIPLAPFTLALVLGNRAEDAFRLSMIGLRRRHESVLVERPGRLDHDIGDSALVLAGHRQGVRQPGAAMVAGEGSRLAGFSKYSIKSTACNVGRFLTGSG
jgi:TctA family transporter